jgi:hypothetical protein
VFSLNSLAFFKLCKSYAKAASALSWFAIARKVRVSLIDKQVKEAAIEAQAANEGPSPLFPHWEVEPYRLEVSHNCFHVSISLI